MIHPDQSALQNQTTQSQCAIIRRYLVQHGYITHEIAEQISGSKNLRSRISDLKEGLEKDGWKLGFEWVKFTTLLGHPGKVKKYLIQKG